jgi:hypothetical protein
MWNVVNLAKAKNSSLPNGYNIFSNALSPTASHHPGLINPL